MLMLPFPIAMIGSGAAPAFSNNTTFNPSDAVSGLTFSNGNKTIARSTADSGQGYGSRGTVGINMSSKKLYLEYKYNVSGSPTGLNLVGLADSSANLTSMTVSNSGQVGLNFGVIGTSISTNGSSNGTSIPSPVNNDIIMCAFDTINNLQWIGINGTWVDWLSAGTQNPSTTTGGITFNLTPSGTWYPVGYFNFAFGSGSVSSTLNGGHDGFAYTVPTGFTAWDA